MREQVVASQILTVQVGVGKEVLFLGKVKNTVLYCIPEEEKYTFTQKGAGNFLPHGGLAVGLPGGGRSVVAITGMR